jgi:hypothetical protein
MANMSNDSHVTDVGLVVHGFPELCRCEVGHLGWQRLNVTLECSYHFKRSKVLEINNSPVNLMNRYDTISGIQARTEIQPTKNS